MSIEDENQQGALRTEQEEKKKVVAEAVEAKCREDESFEEIKAIGDALKAGDELVLHIISGGETNFSYKVCLKSNPHTGVLFAKLSFAFALWNPDRSNHYDVQRTVNEFDIMNSFAENMGGHGNAPVAKPFYCLDVDDDGAKLLVTEWSAADEQFASQFVDGKVDERVVGKLAQALATLNLTEVEPEWNEDCRGCMRSLHPIIKEIYGQFLGLDEKDADSCVMYCKKLGLENLVQIVDNLDKEYMETRQVLCHNDTKQFNILVEKKPNADSFGETGKFVLCDWEMSIKGKSGKDIGIFQAWSIACALAHAVQGHKEESYHLLDMTTKIWDDYEQVLKTMGGKDEAFLTDAFCGALGGTYLYLHIGYYMLALHADSLPLEGISETDATKCKGSIGAAGLKLGEMHFLNKKEGLGLGELKSFVKTTISSEIEGLLAVAAGREVPKRFSVHRKAAHRPSDAAMMAAAARRLSEADGRASIYGDLSIPAAILSLASSDEED